MIERFVLGVNYWPRHSGVQMWKHFDQSEIEADFEALAAIGINTVRVFLLWEDFQNLREFNTSHINGGDHAPFDVLMDDWSDNHFFVNQEMVGKLDVLIDIARRNNLLLIPTLLTSWMSGIVFEPAFIKGRNIFTNPTILRYQTYYVRYFAQRYCNEDQILAWDLGNEQNCVMECAGHDAGWLWTHILGTEIKKWDANHPVTSGMHGLDNTDAGKGGFAIDDVAESMDFLCVHPYPMFFPDECPDRSDNIRPSYLASFQNKLYENISEKPVMAQEFGTFGSSYMSDEIAAKYVKMVLHRLIANGSIGAIYWCAFDFTCRHMPPYNYDGMEVCLGLLDSTGKPTLAGEEFREFASLLRDSSSKRLSPKTVSAILIPWREENQPVLFNSYILGKMAHVNSEFATLEQDFRKYKLLFLPCATNRALKIRDWDKLRSWVHQGGVAYISYNGMQFPEHNEFFGIKTITRQKKDSPNGYISCADALYALTSKNIPFKRCDATSLIVEPTNANVLAYDEKNNPLLLENDYGKGKVYLFTEPIELYLSKSPNVYPGSEIYKLYKWIGSLAGAISLHVSDDPNIEIVEFNNGASFEIDFGRNQIIQGGVGAQKIELPEKVMQTSFASK